MKTHNINRRDFLKRLGLGASAAGLALTGCDSAAKKISASASGATIGDGEMTYRTNPKTGEKVSLLGYGCMRWPTVAGGSARDGRGGD